MNNLTLTNPSGGLPASYDDYPGAIYAPAGADGSEQLGLRDLVRVILRYKTIIFTLVAAITLGVLAWQLLSPKLYRSSVNVQVELIDDLGTNQADVLARNVQRIANEVKLYRSRSSAARVVTDLDLLNDANFRREMGGSLPEDERAQINAATSYLLDMMQVQAEEGSDLINLTVTSRSPELSAEIANAFPEAVREMKARKSERRREALLEELNSERSERMTTARDRAEELAEFRVQNRMLVGSGGAEDLAQLNRIFTEAASASALGAGSAAQSAGMSRAASMQSTAGATNAAVQGLQRQEAELAATVARLSQTYGPNYPDLARAQSELSAVRSNLASEQQRARAAAQQVAAAESARMRETARAQASGDAARAGQLQSVVSRLTADAYRNVSNSPLLSQLENEAVAAAAAVAEISERITRVQSEKMVQGVSSSIISPAVENWDPVSPSPLKFTLIALIGSSILGIFLAFTIEMLDDRLRTVRQISKYFGLPTMGMLPLLEDGISDKLRESPVFADPQSLFAEVARSFYSEVRALRPGAPAQSVLITSPLPGDGKSVVALTLAAAAVAMGKRAVVLDLDLRRSGILQKIQRDINAPELMDIVRGQIDIKSLAGPTPATREFDDEHEAAADTGADSESASALATRSLEEERLSRFALISASEPVDEPSAVLGSSRFQRLVEELKNRYDLVVVNAPATLAVRDARSMCDYTDDAIVVARWGYTTIDQMRATLEMLGSGKVAGCVFDQVDYAEHARRRYGDSVQFYQESSSYFSGDYPLRSGWKTRVGRIFGINRGYSRYAA